ncbi:PLP-dependent aminotransferase family protein [Paracoccus pacificus]|uniref:PLP-dependent aminotransferase family protein n=1 Tax=Paracoccus pacificus TaxID=1463598 RepID=A0ABW4R5H8_9RHOB
MARRQSGAILSGISLDRQSASTLARQLEDQLRAVILSGALPEGSKLPSSRTLAAELGVSRPTVTEALDRLAAEGFLETRAGAGTFVTSALPRHLPQGAPRQAASTPVGAAANVSGFGGRLGTLDADIDVHDSRPFLPNSPAYDHFPFAVWQQCVNRQTQMSYRGQMGYSEPQGHLPLRQSIADYLALHRGDVCTPEQIVITPGAHAAFMLAAQVLTEPEDAILFEDPGPFIARNLFRSLGRRLLDVPVDAEGMDFDAALLAHPDPRMAFVMPSRNHPLGRTLSPARRQKLLDWAEATGGWIIEDDYDSEFRYQGRPLPSMHSIDRAGRVIYVGTFSKALFPALRIGYLVLPPDLVGLFRNAVALMFRCAPLPAQMALAEFIAEGHFATHLRHMRQLYAERRDQFMAAAEQAGAGLFQADRPDSGMNAVVWLPQGLGDRVIAERAAAAGVHGYALSDYCVARPERPGLLLGFAGVAERQFAPGMAALARVVAEAAR